MKKDRKNITQIRLNILNFLINREHQGAVNTRTIEKAVHSNNLTVNPQLDFWASQSVLKRIKVEDRTVGWELNTDLLGLLLASKLTEHDYS